MLWAVCLAMLLAPSPAPAARSDTVVIGAAAEPDTLIGAFSAIGITGEVLTPLFVPMVGFDDAWKPLPRLAEKVPTLKDGDWQMLPGGKMRLTYRLRRGYTWHDGRPVTAYDVVWTHLMLRNPRTPTVSRFILGKIENMLVPDPQDPYTLVVNWNERYPFANFGHTVYPRHAFERDYLRDPSTLKAHPQARGPLGNGPYRFVEWVPGSHITLEAYDKFPGGQPRLRRQVWRFILDGTVLQANVLAGQLDAVSIDNALTDDHLVEIEKRRPDATVHYLPYRSCMIMLNHDNEWLKDVRVRRALVHAINREELSTRLYYGKYRVAHAWVPERHEAFNPNVPKYAYDPARARQLLTEAGLTPGPDGFMRDASGKRVEMTLAITAGSQSAVDRSLILREYLKVVGIDLKLDARPANVLVGVLMRRRQFSHMIASCRGLSPFALGFEWHSGQIPSAANNWEGRNYSGWRNAENDQLLEGAGAELDAAHRVKLLRREQEIWAEDLPAIPMHFGYYATISKKGLRNFRPAAIPWNWNSEVWEWTE